MPNIHFAVDGRGASIQGPLGYLVVWNELSSSSAVVA